eukprot:TRINITY_DN5204_c0_g1_i3.p1 TRINITY_DN5204_c0_g1~~TRINITY_DN5204_c0_g1_i3.p1  ORF type:complete len:364 (+),score=95.90 TRINITY_DN5204_c0_g1_i3:1-1092(+)
MSAFFFFKQKTAYEMLRSLVGSEMCIRDRYQRRVHGEKISDKDMESEDKPSNANEGCPGVKSDEAGKAANCAGCPNQKLCASGVTTQVDPVEKEIEEKLSQIKHKILVLSGKGGVGKSTVSSQIAFGLARQGFDVGLLDVDICGPSIPRMLGLVGHEVHQSNEGWSPVFVDENLSVMSIGFLLQKQDDAIIWRGPRKNGLIKQFLNDVAWGELDFLIIDTPPGTSDEHISIVQYLKMKESDGAVIVTTPQEVALSDVRKEISFCKKTNTPIIGVVENMKSFICPNCSHESHIFAPVTGGAEKMCEDYRLKLLSQIPLDPVLLISSEKGKSIFETHPTSKVAEGYKSLLNGILSFTGEEKKVET